MSKSTESNSTDRPRKAVNLIRREQIVAYENAKEAVKRELGKDDVTQGDVMLEVARAYTGLTPTPGLVAELIDDHASENGDPVFGYDELEAMDPTRLRNLAADANTDAICGKSTMHEVYSYHAARPASPDSEASDG